MASKNLQMFGVENIEAYVEDLKSSITFEVGGMKMFVASMLSDVQEMIAHGDNESARQTLNVVKYMLTSE